MENNAQNKLHGIAACEAAAHMGRGIKWFPKEKTFVRNRKKSFPGKAGGENEKNI
jgi:hypothetical protein